MNIFKSRAQKQLIRDIAIRRGLADIRKTIRSLEKFEESYCAKAKRAQELNAQNEFRFLESAIHRTHDQKRLLERQLLSLETALQLKEQSECHARFCGSMAALARSVGSSFRQADLAKTHASFVDAMNQAQDIEQRMSLFLEETEHLLMGTHDDLGHTLSSKDRSHDYQKILENSSELECDSI
jgi:hypothetical protein